jgi:hypothetical protein
MASVAWCRPAIPLASRLARTSSGREGAASRRRSKSPRPRTSAHARSRSPRTTPKTSGGARWGSRSPRWRICCRPFQTVPRHLRRHHGPPLPSRRWAKPAPRSTGARLSSWCRRSTASPDARRSSGRPSPSSPRSLEASRSGPSFGARRESTGGLPSRGRWVARCRAAVSEASIRGSSGSRPAPRSCPGPESGHASDRAEVLAEQGRSAHG